MLPLHLHQAFSHPGDALLESPVLSSKITAVSALSLSRWCFELYDAEVSGAAALARAAHSVYAGGYSLGGSFRLGTVVSALSRRLLL